MVAWKENRAKLASIMHKRDRIGNRAIRSSIGIDWFKTVCTAWRMVSLTESSFLVTGTVLLIGQARFAPCAPVRKRHDGGFASPLPVGMVQ